MNAGSSHWIVVREVISSTNEGAMVMSALPGLVRRLLDEEAWREFDAPGVGHVEYRQFREFVEAEPPKGLGGRVSQLVTLCGTDEELRTRVERMAKEEIPPAGPVGRPSADSEKVGGTNIKANQVEHVVARLKRDVPELAERVVSGEVSANAAARQMGWRHPRIVVSSPERVAESLRRTMAPQDIARLIAILGEQT